MNQTVDIVQAVIAVLLIISILLQNRGTGLSETFGGGSSNASYQTKRGFDKFLFRASIILSVLFLVTAIYGMIQGA